MNNRNTLTSYRKNKSERPCEYLVLRKAFGWIKRFLLLWFADLEGVNLNQNRNHIKGRNAEANQTFT
jgi:hypothetical protein